LLGVGINIAERKQVEEALQRYNERLTILHQIDQAILAAESPEKITRATLERLVQLVPYQWARVSLYDPDSQKTERIATFSLENFSIDPNIHLPASDTWSHLGELSQSKFHQVEDYLALEHPSVQPRSQITQDGPRITLAAPFITGEKLIGLMEMGRPEPDRFADEEIDISRQVADQLAIAIRQAQLHAQLHRRLDELTVVHRAGQQLQRLQTPVALAQAVIQVVEETLAYDYGTVLLIEPGSDCLLPFALSSQRQGPEFIAQDKAFVASHSPRVGKGITGWVAQTGQSVCLGDVRQDPRYYALRDENIRSELCVPLWAEEQIIGVINVESSRPNAYTEADQRVLETVAAQISVSIQNTHLLEQVERYATQLEQRVAERIAELEQQYRQQATLEERQRLVRDLHDAVSQSLFSASLLAEAIPRLWERHPAKARESLTDLYRLNRGALAEMRNLLLELRPAALAESKLEELLRQLTHAVGGRTQATISLEVKEEGNQLPVDTKIAIFRIAQEALNNITKHAEADRIWISLSSQHEQIRLIIRDNGLGFDRLGSSSGHFGLKIMHERAEAIGATLRIISRPEQGTEVELIWPGTV
jgi:signal transduction histidine kinase